MNHESKEICREQKAPAKKIRKLNQWMKSGFCSLSQEQRDCLSRQLTADAAYQERIRAVYEEEFAFAPWQELILVGRIGRFGGNYLCRFFGEALRDRFPAFYIKRLVDSGEEEHLLPDPDLCRSLGVTAMYPVCEGGMFRTIYDLGKESKLGFAIHYEQIPIRQETIEICEFFDLDPWELYSGNCVILAASHGQQLLDALKLHGFEGVRIGQLTRQITKEVWHHGVPSGINRPKADGLLQLLLKEAEQ